MQHDIQRQTAHTYMYVMARQNSEDDMAYTQRKVAGHIRIYLRGQWVATII